MKNSLIDWISTFKNLPRYPATIGEFITSGTLYFIMEEIDPEYFKEFPYKDLNKQEAKPVQETKTLKKVYKYMLGQMELWFNAHEEASKGMRTFKSDIIDLTKLIEQQDINELLVLIEFIFCIILKCERSGELIEAGFIALGEGDSANDMQLLIEGANIQMSEMPDDDFQQEGFEPGASFMHNASFKADMHQQLQDTENRRQQLEVRMIQMEEEAETFQKHIEEKDKAIAKLEGKVKVLEQGLAKGDVMAAQNLDGISELEAKYAFAQNEKYEL